MKRERGEDTRAGLDQIGSEAEEAAIRALRSSLGGAQGIAHLSVADMSVGTASGAPQTSPLLSVDQCIDMLLAAGDDARQLGDAVSHIGNSLSSASLEALESAMRAERVVAAPNPAARIVLLAEYLDQAALTVCAAGLPPSGSFSSRSSTGPSANPYTLWYATPATASAVSASLSSRRQQQSPAYMHVRDLLSSEHRTRAQHLLLTVRNALRNATQSLLRTLPVQISQLSRGVRLFGSCLDRAHAMLALNLLLQLWSAFYESDTLERAHSSLFGDVLSLCVVTRSFRLASLRLLPVLRSCVSYGELPVTAEDVQLIYYCAGLVSIWDEDFRAAQDSMRLVLAVPANVLTEISLAATKKYIVLTVLRDSQILGAAETTIESAQLSSGASNSTGAASSLPSKPARRAMMSLLSGGGTGVGTGLRGAASPPFPASTSHDDAAGFGAGGKDGSLRRHGSKQSGSRSSAKALLSVHLLPSEMSASVQRAVLPEIQTYAILVRLCSNDATGRSKPVPGGGGAGGSTGGSTLGDDAVVDAAGSITRSPQESWTDTPQMTPRAAGRAFPDSNLDSMNRGSEGGAGGAAATSSTVSLGEFVNQRARDFDGDENLALVQQIVHAQLANKVHRVTRTFLTQNLTSVAERCEADGDSWKGNHRYGSLRGIQSPGTHTADVERLIVDMVCRGEVEAKIDLRTAAGGSVSFDDVLKEPAQDEINDQLLERCTRIIKAIEQLRLHIQQDPEYVKSMVRASRSAGNGTIAGTAAAVATGSGPVPGASSPVDMDLDQD
ncbi:COP9 signalosome complex subunit 3 [Porphyridium purpureum]|uniref:COP9 signalosome complex subunit 3 n=1 Tax=Porphyridium purpureum TaxID=35688 RepID=A0A5J4Z0N0_PORPP|nr:COP9 signalosome complex subunit 3 [Porphyridium purpureum]|eukprot:POR2914..scf208_2